MSDTARERLEKRQIPPRLAADLSKLTKEIAAQQKEPLQKEPLKEAEKILPGNNEKSESKSDKDVVPRSSVIYTFTPFDNPEIRAVIEKRCSVISFDDILAMGSVTQDVPIIPGKLVVTFRSLQGSDTLLAKRAAVTYSTFSALLNDWNNTCLLALAVDSINGTKLGNMEIPVAKKLQEASLETINQLNARANAFVELSDDVQSLLTINYMWFKDRITQLFTGEINPLGNG